MSKATPRLSDRLRIFSTRQKTRGRSRASPRQIVSLRLRDFATLFRVRYHGGPLPDDDSGRDDIGPVIQHLAALPQPKRRAERWLREWAPWLTLAEQEEIITDGLMNARAWRADDLAWRYRVTREERTMLGLTTIGAVDFGKAARTKRRNERDRMRKAKQRRDRDQKLRAEYLAQHSISRTEPWRTEGISRASWYRRQRQMRGTETSAATA